jgi:hypothetical protein
VRNYRANALTHASVTWPRLDPEIGCRHPRYSPSLGETCLHRDYGSVVWTIRTILFRIEIGAALRWMPKFRLQISCLKILKSFHSGMS